VPVFYLWYMKKETKNYNWLLIVVSIVLGLWFVFTFVLFGIKFYGIYLPVEISKLGQMGDYFGGMLNPCLAIANVAVLFYITKEVARLEDKRAEEQIASENRRHLNEFRYEAYKELLEMLKGLTVDKINNQTINAFGIEQIRDRFQLFYNNNAFLFYDNIKQYSDLFLEVNSKIVALQEANFHYEQLETQYMNNEEIITEINKLLQKFSEYDICVSNYKYLFQHTMLNKKFTPMSKS
jgi:uncharacterized membrane protein